MRKKRFTGRAIALLLAIFAWDAIAGAINGTVVVSGRVLDQQKLPVTIDQYVCVTEKDAGDLLLSPRKGLKNAVVWIDNPPAAAATPAQAARSKWIRTGVSSFRASWSFPPAGRSTS